MNIHDHVFFHAIFFARSASFFPMHPTCGSPHSWVRWINLIEREHTITGQQAARCCHTLTCSLKRQPCRIGPMRDSTSAGHVCILVRKKHLLHRIWLRMMMKHPPPSAIPCVCLRLVCGIGLACEQRESTFLVPAILNIHWENMSISFSYASIIIAWMSMNQSHTIPSCASLRSNGHNQAWSCFGAQCSTI